MDSNGIIPGAGIGKVGKRKKRIEQTHSDLQKNEGRSSKKKASLERVVVLLSEEEKRDLEKAARRSGLKTGPFIRAKLYDLGVLKGD